MQEQSDIYRPQYEPLLVRNFIQQNNPNDDYHLTSPYRSPSRCSSIADSHASYQRSINSGSYNSPHPKRVKTIKGLLDLPICVVDDNDDYPNYLQRPESRYSRQVNINSQQAPLDTLSGLPYTTVRNIPQGTKIVPILKRRQEPWQEELKALTQAVFFDTLRICDEELMKTEEYKISHHPFPVCRPVTPTKDQIRRSVYSQISVSNPRPYSHMTRGPVDTEWKDKRIQDGLNEIRMKSSCPNYVTSLSQNSSRRLAATQLTYEDQCQEQVFQILSRLLNTNDSSLVAKWLDSASEREKSLILQIMRTVIPGAYNPPNNETNKPEDASMKESFNKPQTSLVTVSEDNNEAPKDISKKEVSSQVSFNDTKDKTTHNSLSSSNSRPISRQSSVIHTVPNKFPNLRNSYVWPIREKKYPRASVLADDVLSNRAKTAPMVTLRYTTNNRGKNSCL